jgi:hypothetical protein
MMKTLYLASWYSELDEDGGQEVIARLRAPVATTVPFI